MSDTRKSLKAVVLAAGLGRRLRPITDSLPKALCPVGTQTLVDRAIERASPLVEAVAVNVHAGRNQMLRHLSGQSVHVSVEDEILGTAGAVANLRSWIDGSDCLVLNADAYLTDDLSRLVCNWEGTTIRLLVSYDTLRPDFHGMWRFAGASLLPRSSVLALPVGPSDLYSRCWNIALAEQRVEFIPTDGVFIDCGRPEDLLAANLVASSGGNVVQPGAEVLGRIDECLVLAGARVAAEESLTRAIRLPSGETLLPFASSLLEVAFKGRSD